MKVKELLEAIRGHNNYARIRYGVDHVQGPNTTLLKLLDPSVLDAEVDHIRASQCQDRMIDPEGIYCIEISIKQYTDAESNKLEITYDFDKKKMIYGNGTGKMEMHFPINYCSKEQKEEGK